MPVIINKSAALQSLLIKNKDTRSESIDSFSSTFDVHAPSHGQSKLPHPDKVNEELIEDDLSSTPTLPSSIQLVNSSPKNASSPHFDFKLPPNQTLTPEEQERQQSALNSILILSSPDCCPRVSNLLSKYNAHLVNVGSHLLEGLQASAPNQLAARVGDYNENLFYEMRDIDCIGSYICNASGSSHNHDSESSSPSTRSSSSIEQDVTAFENSIRTSLTSTHSSSQNNNIKYRGSFMSTEGTAYQPAHYDYDYTILQQYGHSLFLAFFPLTEEGSYLQLWQEQEEREGSNGEATVEGTVVYIPYGKMLIAPSDTLHGGGFKRGSSGNLRFHLYIEVICDEEEAPTTAREVAAAAAKGEEETKKEDGVEEEIKELLDHPMNKYTERHDRRRELCERFVDARGLDSLLGVFFDT